MNVRRDPDRLIHAFLMEGQTELADQVYDAVRSTIERRRQRVFIGPWRFPDMNKLVPIGLGAAAVIAVLFVGARFLGTPNQPGAAPGAVPTATGNRSWSQAVRSSGECNRSQAGSPPMGQVYAKSSANDPESNHQRTPSAEVNHCPTGMETVETGMGEPSSDVADAASAVLWVRRKRRRACARRTGRRGGQPAAALAARLRTAGVISR